MRKLQIILVLLVAGILVAGCGFMPMILARIQDYTSMNQIQYEQVNSVELAFVEDEPSLPLLEKLNILKFAGSIEIDANETNMSEAEAKAAFLNALQPFLDSGVIPVSLDNMEIWIYPQVAYNREDPREFMTVWTLDIVSHAEPYQSLGAVLDDETGKILSISYTSYTEEAYERPDSAEEHLLLLAQVYFDGLGIQPINEEDWYNTEATKELLHVFDTPDHGLLIIGFSLHSEGFFTYFA